MKILGSIWASSTQKDPASNRRLTSMMQLLGQGSSSTWLYFLGLAIATIGVGAPVNQAIAQVYYRQAATTQELGTVSTRSGIGLNIRSGPGLSYPVIGGVDDGVVLDLMGTPVLADGYRWQSITARGGWVATEYLAGGNLSNIGFPNCDCYQSNSSGNGNSIGFPSRPIQPIIRPISTNQGGAYIVAVPGTNPVDLIQVRRIVPGAYLDRAREGRFINAGGYSSFDAANSVTYFLRNNNLNARVIYGR